MMTVFIGSGGLISIVLEGALPAILLVLFNDRLLDLLEGWLIHPALRASTDALTREMKTRRVPCSDKRPSGGETR